MFNYPKQNTYNGGKFVNKHQISGFTLIELMITIVIASTILVLATPSYERLIRENKLTSATNEFILAIQRAKNEAITRGKTVTLCVSDTFPQTGCTNGTMNIDFAIGWITFIDANADNGPDNPSEDIIWYNQGIEDVKIADVGSSYYIQFSPEGYVSNNPTSSTQSITQLLVCDSNSNGTGRVIDLARPGGQATVTNLMSGTHPGGHTCSEFPQPTPEGGDGG